MDEPRWLTDDEQTTWRALVRLTRRVYSALAKDLLETTGLSGADFEILVALTDHPDARVRAKDLVAELEWDKSRLSHQIKRMETRGLVAREECAADRRGTFVAATPAGRELLARAAPSHVQTVRRLVIDALPPEQLAALGHLAASLVDRSEPASSATSSPRQHQTTPGKGPGSRSPGANGR